jgi:hypothetical protein
VSRSALAAWAVLLVSTAAAAALLVTSTTTSIGDDRIVVGNGTGSYRDSETTVVRWRAWGAIAVAALGAGAWAVLLTRSSSSARRASVAAAAVIVFGGVSFAAGVPTIFDDPFEGQPRFNSPAELKTSLDRNGLPCAGDRALEARPWFDALLSCGVETEADIRDGADDLIVGVFGTNDERRSWTEHNDHADVYAVLGPTWVVTCEFQATCAQIQAAVGGFNY